MNKYQKALNHLTIYAGAEMDSNDFVDILQELVDRECLQEPLKGTLIELPCKVGDTIYFIREAVHTNPSNPIIEETTIDKIIITKSGLRVKLSCNSTYESSIRNFGKTMFFTKEAAEARLKELEEQK